MRAPPGPRALAAIAAFLAEHLPRRARR
jgi:hypothetical protein